MKVKSISRWTGTIIGYGLIVINGGLVTALGILCIHVALVLELIEIIGKVDKNEKSNF
jgi:hypothetical protein